MVIFHSYVSLPEGIYWENDDLSNKKIVENGGFTVISIRENDDLSQFKQQKWSRSTGDLFFSGNLACLARRP
jgi:hypothetical protein